ncbi:glycerophosphodiester phosphodiesterase [Bacillus lacus]|uniref:Glycerophosphodiester phosphodiesterase n=1 Tax=Metabacillus lacus TaxID=1983721 RepID=A0A7X2J1W8_9BACI|nr:glycerophosphodiester phosphodiesterase [Metabacillus lacus]MRX73153.1 glycerophosphodiester phosphodiesterase [Metabacillus lacus]
MTQIFGHRGAAGTCPENTMVSFKAAFEAGADGIELDVQMSSDGQIVVIHDEKLDRTTNLKGFVKDFSYRELSKADASYKFADYAGHAPIPLLEEVLQWAASIPHFLVNIELKNGIIDYEGIEEKVIKIIRNFQMEKAAILSSFNHYSLAKCRELSEEIELGVLYSEGLYKPWEYAAKLKAGALHPHVYAVNRDIIVSAQARGISVRPFTVNNEAIMKELYEQNCSGFFTDYPEKARVLIPAT